MLDRFRDRLIGTGIPWYARQDYPIIFRVMADIEVFFDTYDEWLEKAEQHEAEIARLGGRPVRVHLDPEKFVAWCAANHANVDAEGRKAFARDMANWPTH